MFTYDAVAAQECEKEIGFLREIPAHENIIRLLMHSKEKAKRGFEFLLVFELCSSSLFSLMSGKSEKGEHLESVFVMNVMAQIASALDHIHGYSLVHRDVKPENILSVRNGSSTVWKLVDFGSATKGTYIPKSDERAEFTSELESKTTLIYRAPEMLDLFRNHPIGPKADVWALGCTMFYAAYLVHPFKDEGELAILNGKYEFPQQEHLPKGRLLINTIIATLLVQDPANRPEAAQVKRVLEEKIPQVYEDGVVLLNVKKVEPQGELAEAVKMISKSPRSKAKDKSPRLGQSRPSPPPSAARASSDGVVQANESIIANVKGALSTVKKLSEPDIWKMEVGVSVVFPQLKDIHIAAESVSDQGVMGQFYGLFKSKERGGGSFVVEKRAIDCLQMLSLFHAALQSGSFLSMASAERHKGFLEDVVSLNDHVQGELVQTYAAFLAAKVNFHSKHKFVEGNMSLGTYHMVMDINTYKSGRTIDQRAQDQYLVTTEMLKEAFMVLGRAIHVESLILSFKDYPSIIPFLIPVVKETFSMLSFAAFCLKTHWITPQKEGKEGFLGVFQRCTGAISSHYEEVKTIDVLMKVMGAPPSVDNMLEGPCAYPPSHSPYVKAFLEKQQQNKQSNAQPAFPTSFHASVPPSFPAQFESNDVAFESQVSFSEFETKVDSKLPKLGQVKTQEIPSGFDAGFTDFNPVLEASEQKEDESQREKKEEQKKEAEVTERKEEERGKEGEDVDQNKGELQNKEKEKEVEKKIEEETASKDKQEEPSMAANVRRKLVQEDSGMMSPASRRKREAMLKLAGRRRGMSWSR